MRKRPHQAMVLVQLLLLSIALLLELTGLLFLDILYMLAGTTLLFAANIIYACSNLRSRSLFLLLHLGMFLFWLTRPLIGVIYGTSNWMDASSPNASVFSLGVIFLTMAFLRAGDFVAHRQTVLKKHPKYTDLPNARPDGKRREIAPLGRKIDSALWLHSIRVVSLTLFLIFVAAALLCNTQAYTYSRAYTYEEFHLIDLSAYSSEWMSSLSTMLPVATCAYLATFPNKKSSTAVLLLYVLQTIPSLLIGARSGFVLAIVFFGFYYLVRHTLNPDEGWIGTKETVTILVGLPLGILLMGMVNYLRASGAVGTEGALAQIADALYKQGVTFKTLQYGYNVNDLIQDGGFRFFTLGSLVNAITQGFVGQLFLGSELLPETNSVELALRGPWYSHAMSYYAHSNYLGGEGYGSSYVLELFADFGIAGVVVGSFFLGAVFALLSKGSKNSWIAMFAFLMAARRVFFMPRGEFCEWISWIWSTRMLAALILIALLSACLYLSITRLRKSTGPDDPFAPAQDTESCGSRRQTQPIGFNKALVLNSKRSLKK